MAIDEAIFKARRDGIVPPTLRVYEWSSPAVSLGRLQSFSDIDLDACRELGVSIVRRITGGKAAIHGRDISYSVCASHEDSFCRSAVRTYSIISRCLEKAFESMGLDVEVVRERIPSDKPACFSNPSFGDVVFRGTKLAGGAQAWRAGYFIQQGTILLDFDPDVHSAIFGDFLCEADQESGTAFKGHFPSGSPNLERIKYSLSRGFERLLGVRFRRSKLTDIELLMARELIAKYADSRWTMHREHSGRAHSPALL